MWGPRGGVHNLCGVGKKEKKKGFLFDLKVIEYRILNLYQQKNIRKFSSLLCYSLLWWYLEKRKEEKNQKSKGYRRGREKGKFDAKKKKKAQV